VPYQPGIIKAKSKKNGNIILTKEIRTAGTAAKILLTADRLKLKANGKDLSFITVKLVDKDGNFVPDADKLLQFSVTGAGSLAGTDNGFPADSSSLKSPQRKTWKGMALGIVQSSEKKGNITILVTAEGLKEARLTLLSE
jgi:beta-galactosidase